MDEVVIPISSVITSPVVSSKQLECGDGIHFDLCFSKSCELLACAGGIDGLSLVRTPSSEKERVFSTTCGRSPTFSSRADLLAACSMECAEVWDVHSGVLLQRFTWPENYSGEMVKCILHDKHGPRLTVLTYAFMRTWDISERAIYDTYLFFTGERVIDARLAEDGRLLVYTCRTSKKRYTHLYVTDVVDRHRLAEIPVNCDYPPIISPDGRLALSRPHGREAKYQIWNLTDKRLLSEFQYNGILANLTDILFLATSNYLVYLSDGVMVRDIYTGQLLRKVVLDGVIQVCQGISDPVIAVLCQISESEHMSTVFIDALSGRVTGHSEGSFGRTSLIAPDGHWFATIIDHDDVVGRMSAPPIGTLTILDIGATAGYRRE